MIKKIAYILIAISMLTIATLHIASAYHNCITGNDYSYYDGQDPWFCQCHHDVWMGDSEDSMAGLSLIAEYVFIYYPQSVYFDWAQWAWEAQWGDGDVQMNPGLSIDACINGDNHNYYTDYSDPVWGYPPLSGYDCWFVYLDMDGELGYVESVESSCTASFYHPSDPPGPPTYGEIWWLDAYTQNPPNDPYGNGWSYLYAHLY